MFGSDRNRPKDYRRAVVIDAGSTNAANKHTLRSECECVRRNSLTEPTLLERSDNPTNQDLARRSRSRATSRTEIIHAIPAIGNQFRKYSFGLSFIAMQTLNSIIKNPARQRDAQNQDEPPRAPTNLKRLHAKKRAVRTPSRSSCMSLTYLRRRPHAALAVARTTPKMKQPIAAKRSIAN